MKKDLTYYRGLPYTLRTTRSVDPEDGQMYYYAAYEELPVRGVHEDRLLAIKLAKELFDSYVEAQLAWGEPVPEPESRRSPKHGGRYTFRRVYTYSGDDPALERISVKADLRQSEEDGRFGHQEDATGATYESAAAALG